MILFGRAKTGSPGLDAHEKVEKTGTTRQRFQHIGHGHLKKKKKMNITRPGSSPYW